MNKRNYFVCIGAVHQDYILKIKKNFFKYRTNPIIHDEKLGGVAFNIASKLAFLNEKVELNSLNCNLIQKKEIKKRGIIFKGLNKQIDERYYTSIINNRGQMIFGLANMDVYEKNLNKSIFKKHKNKRIIFDLNLSGKFIRYLINKYYRNNYICVCGTSAHKVHKIKSLLKKIDTLILNKKESLILTKTKSIYESLNFLINKNNNLKIIITDGKNSVYAYEKNRIYLCKPPEVKVKNENTAGDALSAVFNFYYCITNKMNESLKKGVIAGALQASNYSENKIKYLKKIDKLYKNINIKVREYD